MRAFFARQRVVILAVTRGLRKVFPVILARQIEEFGRALQRAVVVDDALVLVTLLVLFGDICHLGEEWHEPGVDGLRHLGDEFRHGLYLRIASGRLRRCDAGEASLAFDCGAKHRWDSESPDGFGRGVALRGWIHCRPSDNEAHAHRQRGEAGVGRVEGIHVVDGAMENRLWLFEDERLALNASSFCWLV